MVPQRLDKDMPQETDVAIIGGGIIGCSIAYFLRKRGVQVMVFEKGAIGGQASGAAAGLLAPLGPLAGPGPFADLLLAGLPKLQLSCQNWRMQPDFSSAMSASALYALSATISVFPTSENALKPGNHWA